MLSLMLNEVALPPQRPPRTHLAGASADAAGAGAAPPPRFPTYLLPSFSRPFRRHRGNSPATGDASADRRVLSSDKSPTSLEASRTASSTVPSWFSHAKSGFRRPSTEQSGISKLTRIQPDTIRCSTCGTDFAFYSQVVSKGFTGRHGRAYLVSPPTGPSQTSGADLMNIKVGKPENRVLVTGKHVVSDIQCATCRARVGWKYIDAKEESQKYKIGKFIVETQRTVDYRNWDDATADELLDLDFDIGQAHHNDDADPVEFDSDDSDECDDLFAGVWDAQSAKNRRLLRLNRRQK
ncbi:yippee-domain-containing protein [Nemania sp. FL0916]|nr:yippee-domain-containing protein [Nemania sp. FL0916]